jgi:alanine dehydrogenase
MRISRAAARTSPRIDGSQAGLVTERRKAARNVKEASMNIGVLKEVKQDERRVALLPIHARILSGLGHTVYVEFGAGEGAGFTDVEYQASGAKLVAKDEVLSRSRLLLKVKAPLRTEYDDYAPHHILFTYLHFDENIAAKDLSALVGRGFTGIAYEWVGSAGQYPLLEPMSRLTGYLFAQKSLELCATEKGIFCPRNESLLPGGRALIIGCGNIGLSAFKYLSDLGIPLTLVVTKGSDDFNRKANERFGTAGIDYLRTTGSDLVVMDNKDPSRTKDAIASILAETDIVLNCAVRRAELSKTKMEYLIDRAMVRVMQRGSIVCDCTACDQDMIETCTSSASLYSSYREHDVVHYNCDHIPAMVASTATRLLTARTFAYVRHIADLGSVQAVSADDDLRNGICCCASYLTHELSARKKGLPHRPLGDVLETLSTAA